MELTRKHSFHGELTVPGDKSISHRGIMPVSGSSALRLKMTAPGFWFTEKGSTA